MTHLGWLARIDITREIVLAWEKLQATGLRQDQLPLFKLVFHCASD